MQQIVSSLENGTISLSDKFDIDAQIGAVDATMSGILLRIKSSKDSIWCSTSLGIPCCLKYVLIVSHSMVVF